MPLNRCLAYVCGVVLAAGCQPDDQAKIGNAAGDGARWSRDAAQVQATPAPRILPETHLASGRMLEHQGDLRAAVAQYERAIAANPRFVAAYNQLGMLHQKMGRPADAEHIFKQGLKADPAAAALHNNLGYCYLAQQRYTDAEKEFRDALDLNPAFKRARMNLAIVLANTGREAAAFAEFREVVPDDVAHYNLAVIAISRQDYAVAEKALREALAVNPQCAGAKEQLERVLAVVRGRPAGPSEPQLSGLEGEPPGEPQLGRSLAPPVQLGGPDHIGTALPGSGQQLNGASPIPETPADLIPLAGTADAESRKTP